MQTRTEALNEIANIIIKVLDKNLRSCLNCNNFYEERETCYKFNARPPARIIAKACEHWEDFDIPF